MTSRKKSKKSNKPKPKIEDSEKVIKFDPYLFFNSTEISQIKTALKVKESLNIPIAIGCVILNNIETLDKAVKSEVDINEIGPNYTTALIWAIRNKYLDIIKYLLENGADPQIKADNGENVIIIALEHKLWDEASFIEFWLQLTAIIPIDVNTTNKNGHTIIHIAVRREWKNLIQILLKSENVNLNITNINGVTPLMTACYRNNIELVNILINYGADFTKEDNHYRTALCYAVVTGGKLSTPPFVIAERIIFELKKDLSFKEYIKRKIEIIHLVLQKEKISEPEIDMLVTVTRYLVQHTENGLKIILEFNVFESFEKILSDIKDNEKKKILLQLSFELFSYNEQVANFNYEAQLKMSNQFICSRLVESCFEIIKNQEANINLAFYVVLLFSTLNDTGQKWAKENSSQFIELFKLLPTDIANHLQEDVVDEKRQKLIKKKIKKLKRIMNINDEKAIEELKNVEGNETVDEKKGEVLFNIKKSKRRSKVYKAKITKIKNMELAERLTLKPSPTVETKIQKLEKEANLPTIITNDSNEAKTADLADENLIVEDIVDNNAELPSSMSLFDIEVARKIQEDNELVNTFMNDDLFCPCNENGSANPITTALKQFLDSSQIPEEKPEPNITSAYPEWKSKIYKLPFNDWTLFSEKMKTDKEKLRAAIEFMKKSSLFSDDSSNSKTLETALITIVEYLKELLDIIIAKCKSGWDLKENMKSNATGKKSNYLERQAITELQDNFNHLIGSICSLIPSNTPEALRHIYRLESTLLRFPIRNRTLLSDVCALEQVKIQYTTYSAEAETSFLSYIENALNGFEESRTDVKITVVDGSTRYLESEPPGLFAKETSMLSPSPPRNKRKELDAKIKTMENAYHLIDSIEKLVVDDDELPELPKIESSFFRELNAPKGDESESKYVKLVSNILIKHVRKGTKGLSRWFEKLEHLRSMKHTRLLLGGAVRLCSYPERNHVISQGGNFNLVMLGLSASNQPLAVKKIPSKHCAGDLLKSLITPLLELRHKNILNYFICAYEKDDLILATPLCEYNIGQYVVLLNENLEKEIFSLTRTEIVKQFLTGLAFLHEQINPVVHGNLKPSNIFVDINGVVRVAEFGIYKALFKLIEAPKTSLIWFSQETYKLYKVTSKIECSTSSDIQVAGMLIYFILCGGEHPFGPEVLAILGNLGKPTYNFHTRLDTKDPVLADLVTWMLVYEPNDRPFINQVLTHVFFWSNDKRWRFILNCCGLTIEGSTLDLNVADLHKIIDETAAKEHITGHWVSIARRKFSQIKLQDDDTVVGLLKFVKQFYDQKMFLNETMLHDLKNWLFTYFPAFPLTLFRILETTGMTKNYPFVMYTVPESM